MARAGGDPMMGPTNASRAAIAVVAAVFGATLFAACGSDETDDGAESNAAGGLRLVSVADAAAVLDNRPDDLVVLDIRTPEEFAAGYVEGAMLIDFYRSDFRDQLAGLDPDVPYVLYCNSGNRSGQAIEMMRQLGFNDVADVDGGIVAWRQAGLPLAGG